MQLVDEGKVDLDATVQTYLPEFEIGDKEAAAVITVRQLLNHTSGFEGDIFTDTGVGDDASRSTSASSTTCPSCSRSASGSPTTTRATACSAGWSRCSARRRYDDCLREHLFAPLGLTHAATSPYDAIMFRAAMGHIELEPGAGYQPAPVWTFARSNAPAGSMLSMRPRDLLKFAAMHLNDGKAEDGTQVLAPGTAARMHAKQVELPDLGLMGTSWGLGFERFDTPDGAIIGHDGSTIGQNAFMRMVPEAGVAIALLTNGGDDHLALPGALRPRLRRAHRHPPAGAAGAAGRPAARSTPAGTSAPTRPRSSTSIVSQDDDGRIWIEMIPKGMFEELGEQPGAQGARRTTARTA